MGLSGAGLCLLATQVVHEVDDLSGCLPAAGERIELLLDGTGLDVDRRSGVPLAPPVAHRPPPTVCGLREPWPLRAYCFLAVPLLAGLPLEAAGRRAGVAAFSA